MKGKNRDRIFEDELVPVTGAVQFYVFAVGAPAFIEDGVQYEEFWIDGMVRARSPAKARKKARRIQLKTGWPLLEVNGLPSRTRILTEEDTGPPTRFSKAHMRWQTLVDGRWVDDGA